jgi:hypothetical protein
MAIASSNSFDPEEFVKLIASFDTGNPSEAEAMTAGRLMRRSLVTHGLRLVDVMGRPDVIQALDDQLQPVREESPELKEAFQKVADLADLAKQREDIIDELQQELARGAGNCACPMTPSRASQGGLVSAGLVNGVLVAAVSLATITLLIASAFR